MADPLSLVASVIAVVGAAESISNSLSKLRLLRNAPDGLLALNNEIADLKILLRTIEGYLSSDQPHRVTIQQDVLDCISILITRAKDHVLQLEQLIHYRFLESGSLEQNYKVFRLRWIRAKDTVESHRRALQDIRQSIQLQLLLVNS